LSMVQRLRLGHLSAAAVLAVPDDHATPPDARVRRALLDCSDEDWARTQVGPAGIESPALMGGVV
jgi:2-dehydro-3-deoxygluconokinase